MKNPYPLVIKDLFFDYADTSVLASINLSIEEGEFVGIFGPNGGGKTTLLKLILGLLKPSRGQIEVLGESPKAARKKMGYVPQAAKSDKQFPISVLEVVLMGCLSEEYFWGGAPASSREKARIALARVGLLDKADAPFGTLSGGQAQRALIARALVSQPELLLLDEPTASVDPEAEKVIHDILAELKGKTTILMVTHDLKAILQDATRLICVQKEITSYAPSELCRHFSLGLYHSPLKLS